MASVTSRLTRLVASTITRRTQPRRLFCTDSPSSATAGGTRSGFRYEDYFDSSEVWQVKEHDKNTEIFFRKERSLAEQHKFFQEEYDKMQKSEAKYPGEVTKYLKGKYKGWRLYKPTLEVVPTSLPRCPDFFEEEDWKLHNDIFMKNRERWYKEGIFNILFEGDVFRLGIMLEDRCFHLTDCVLNGISLDSLKS